MAGGLFSRITTRPTGNTIDGPADDADWDNIINNLLPAKLDDYSVNNAQMDSTSDPFPGASQSLATTLAKELEHIRFILEQITGEANWYIDPDTDLATTFAHFSDTTTHGTTGDIVGTTDTQVLTNKTLTTPTIGSFVNATHDHQDAAGGGVVGINLQTETDTTSGTTHDYTSIASTVKRITIMFNGVSTSGGDDIWLQLGDSGGFETSGYVGAVSELTATAAIQAHVSAFVLSVTHGATDVLHGKIELNLENASTFTWTISGNFSHSDAARNILVGGSKSLSAALTQIRLTTSGGTDTFDAGEFNVAYE